MNHSNFQSRYQHLVFDIHGVLLGRTEPADRLPAAVVMSRLRKAGYSIRFLTNTSSVSRVNIALMLQDVGIAAAPSEVYTAAVTVAHYLCHVEPQGRLFVIGSNELREEISRSFGTKNRWCSLRNAEVVVVSRDLCLDQTMLEDLSQNKGARLIATCRDSCFMNKDGIGIGPGETVALVERIHGSTAKVLGKPNDYVLTDVMGFTSNDLARTLVIGDSLVQDIGLANRAGAGSVLLSTPGRSSAGGKNGASLICPDRVITSLDNLLDFL